ncbi:MAG TPA: PspC domain-containing protein [Actinomycetes bacterium]|nr:PspC domain-containing protein [Actinomycetes bacterium]
MSERPPEASPGEQAPSPATASSTAQPPPPIEPPPAAPGAGPAPGPAPGAPAGPMLGAVRRLTRRADRRMIAGVAGGIADYLGIEAWVVRLGFIVLVPFGGFGLLAYLIAWLLVPVAGSDQSLASAVLRRPPSGLRSYIGAGLILLAVAILASAFSEPSVIWAIALIAFGIFLFRQDDLDPPDRRPPPGGGGPGPTTATAPLPAVPPAPTTTATTELLAPPPVSDRGTSPLPPDVPVWSPPPPPDQAAAWGSPPPRRPRRRAFLGPLTFAVALIATGLALALDNLGVVDLSLGQVLAVFLTVLGAGMLVGTWWGRAWGLIPVGLLAVPVVALTALAGSVPVKGGVAERLFQPTTPAEVRSGYRLAGGELVLDLSKVRFGPGAPPIQASVAGGRLLVVVPDEVAANVRGRVGVGSLDLLGHVDTGAQVDSSVTEPPTRPPARGTTAPTVRLDLQAGYGVIEVRRASDPRSFDQAGPFAEPFTTPAIPKPPAPAEAP